MKKSFIGLTSFIASLFTLLVVSCGPALKPPTDKSTLSISAEKTDLGNIKMGETAATTLSIKAENIASSIVLESSNPDFTLNKTDLPATGGNVTLTFKAKSEGKATATITAHNREASVSSSITITASVGDGGGGGSSEEGTIEITYKNENYEETTFTEKEIALGEIYVAENYFSSEEAINNFATKSFSMDLKATGLKDMGIKAELQGGNTDVISINKTEIPCKKGKSIARGTLTITANPKQEGDYSTTLVLTYGSKELKFPVSVSLKKGPADIIEGSGNGISSKTSADLFGKKIPNGATVKISTASIEYGQLSPQIMMHFPETGYRGVATLEKEGKFGWCITGTCVPGMKDTGENGIPEKDTLLFFEIGDKLVAGYKNKVHFVFTKGDDKYEFTLDINITHTGVK